MIRARGEARVAIVQSLRVVEIVGHRGHVLLVSVAVVRTCQALSFHVRVLASAAVEQEGQGNRLPCIPVPTRIIVSFNPSRPRGGLWACSPPTPRFCRSHFCLQRPAPLEAALPPPSDAHQLRLLSGRLPIPLQLSSLRPPPRVNKSACSVAVHHHAVICEYLHSFMGIYSAPPPPFLHVIC